MHVCNVCMCPVHAPMYSVPLCIIVRVRVQRVHDVICKFVCGSMCVCTSVYVYVKMHACTKHVCAYDTACAYHNCIRLSNK